MAEQGFSRTELSKSIYSELLSLIEQNIQTKKQEILLNNLNVGGYTLDPNGILYIIHYKEDSYEYVVNSDPPKHRYDYPVIEIHAQHELESEFSSLQEDINTLQRERVKLNNYIRIMLNQCDTIADLYTIFPPSLHRYLPDRPNDSRVTVSKKTIEKIDQLKAKYGQFVEELMFKNFLQA